MRVKSELWRFLRLMFHAADMFFAFSSTISKTSASVSSRFPNTRKQMKARGRFGRVLSPVYECLEIVMKHDARVFEMTSLKKQYKIMQCRMFSHFSLKCLVCVICCIQSAFIVFVSFCF